jgi:hypothetical protein
MLTVFTLLPVIEHDPPVSLDCCSPNWKLQFTPAVIVKSEGNTTLK